MEDSIARNELNQKSPVDNWRGKISLRLYGLLAIFLGGLGIHDFAVKEWRLGCTHLVLTILAILSFRFISIDSFLPPTLLFINWVFAIVELIKYRKNISTIEPFINQRKTFLINAIVADSLMILVILAHVLFLLFLTSSRSCYASGCDSAGWAVVILVWISALPIMMAVFFVVNAFSQYKRLSREDKSNKIIRLNALIMDCFCMIWLGFAIVAIVDLALNV